jgi:hypothetical protein
MRTASPGGLRVQFAYQVGPAPECSNWYAALRKARSWAGCTNTGTTKNACQERIQSCERGCDICPLLAPGQGPPAFFEDLGDLFRDVDDTNSIGGMRGRQTVGRGASEFNVRLCEDISWVDVLGSTMIHEALHHCHGGRGISDYRGEQSGCSANALERFCTGISGRGGN